jgi:L-asparaginase/Glu-tRNA(Gln) amidotransferase subunit D
MRKEAVLKLHAYMKFDSSKLSEQQAVDKLEEIMHELDETHGIVINIHDRHIQDSP